jgi:tight adherence protein B
VKLLVALAIGSAVWAWARVVVGNRRAARIGRRIEAHLSVGATAPHEDPLGRRGRAMHAVDVLERRLRRHRRWSSVERRFTRAGVERRPVELVVGVAGVSVVFMLLGVATGSALVVLLALVGPAAIGWVLLDVLAQRRLRAFDEQLPDLLSALGSSLRAGHGFLQSLQAAAHDIPDPVGRELRRALAEMRAGRPVEEALATVHDRVPSRDLQYVLTAIAVQRQVGGSLAGLFETVNETVRHRQQFARKVRALTATGRMSANALIAMPIGVALFLSLINHHYLVPMVQSHYGRLMLVLGGGSMLVGALVVRRVVSFKG